MEFEAAVSRGIAAERARAGLTQHQLADAIGVQRSALSDIERGARRVTAVELLAVCRATGAPLQRLLASADRDDLEALGL